MTNEELIREKVFEALRAIAGILPLLSAPPSGPQLELWVNEALLGRAHTPACGSEVKKIRRRAQTAPHRRRREKMLRIAQQSGGALPAH